MPIGTSRFGFFASASSASSPDDGANFSLDAGHPYVAQTFTVLDSKLKNPQTGHWERAFRIFDLLL